MAIMPYIISFQIIMAIYNYSENVVVILLLYNLINLFLRKFIMSNLNTNLSAVKSSAGLYLASAGTIDIYHSVCKFGNKEKTFSSRMISGTIYAGVGIWKITMGVLLFKDA